MDRTEAGRVDRQHRDRHGRGSVGIPHTAAARAVDQNLAASFCVEWAPNQIRINTVAVGVVRSPGLLNHPPEARPSFDHNPQRRLGGVHDVAQAVALYTAIDIELFTHVHQGADTEATLVDATGHRAVDVDRLVTCCLSIDLLRWADQNAGRLENAPDVDRSLVRGEKSYAGGPRGLGE